MATDEAPLQLSQLVELLVEAFHCCSQLLNAMVELARGLTAACTVASARLQPGVLQFGLCDRQQLLGAAYGLCIRHLEQLRVDMVDVTEKKHGLQDRASDSHRAQLTDAHST